jgi:hypothetical protein
MDAITILITAFVMVASFAGGYFIGSRRQTAITEQPQPEPKPLTVDEQRKVEEENEAFTLLLGYNSDIAYGMVKKK